MDGSSRWWQVKTSDFGHLTPGQVTMYADVLVRQREQRERRNAQGLGRRHFPTTAARALLQSAQADGVVDPGWECDGVRLVRRPETCWDYLAAAVWFVSWMVASG